MQQSSSTIVEYSAGSGISINSEIISIQTDGNNGYATISSYGLVKTSNNYYSIVTGNGIVASQEALYNVYKRYDGEGDYNFKENSSTRGAGTCYCHNEGYRNYISYGCGVHVEGANCSASADSDGGSHAEGNGTTVAGMGGHAEGYYTQAEDVGSHSEGLSTFSFQGHSEGYQTLASGKGAHAEGIETTAISFNTGYGINIYANSLPAHAEGKASYAANNGHAEGYFTTAIGKNSHTSGNCTSAGYEDQFVIGHFNINKAEDVFEIGWGGDSGTRKNILRVDQNGNLYITGYIYTGQTGT